MISLGLNKSEILYLQDFLPTVQDPHPKTELEPSEAFFELANAKNVGFRTVCKKYDVKCSDDNSKVSSKDIDNQDDDEVTREIVIQQDNSCKTHTGGIVWETSFLLACFLQEKYSNQQSRPLGKVLEVGAGCGMLGLVLASSGLCQKVVMTETTEVLPNLVNNMNLNVNNREIDRHMNATPEATQNPLETGSISVRRLRWDNVKKDILACQQDGGSDDLKSHSFDTIVGTDVVFSTKLVKPLLKTLQKLSHSKTSIYLCLQIRCADSHALLLNKAGKYGFDFMDCTDELKEMPVYSWGLELECKILRFSIPGERGKDKRKRKLDKCPQEERKRMRG